MESRGQIMYMQAKDRPAITRRSCDQCRTRKVGCDRGRPCGNCINAQCSCTYSAVQSNTTAPKQRVLISAQYEQKIDGIARDIDGIARDIDGIKLLLKDLSAHSVEKQSEQRSTNFLDQAGSANPKPLAEHKTRSAPSHEALWDHSVQTIDFVKAILEDRSLRAIGPEGSEVFSALKQLVQDLEKPAPVRDLSIPRTALSKDNPPMPPIEAVVEVLRWAKDHEGFTMIARISHVLPLQMFTDICRKVYFAVEEYGEVDFILANAYLKYVFAEHIVVSGRQDFRKYCELCEHNFHDSLSRLPLLLPTSMEVIAILTLGSYHAVENSQAKIAWKFISAASDLCQTLGYHRLSAQIDDNRPLRDVQESLFWTVYAMERGISLRLGRPSNIHDADITLLVSSNESRSVKLGRINGMVYDQLYSPTSLLQPVESRNNLADVLAGELRELINDTHAEISDVARQPENDELDPMRLIYLRCDLVCQSSLLALVLRASSEGSALIECVAVARDVLDKHEQCMQDVRGCKNDPSMAAKYVNWAILYCPFAPFSILFARAVQLADGDDLDRLNQFAASLQLEALPADAMTHPYRLYQLLCQAARLYFDSNSSLSWPSGRLGAPIPSHNYDPTIYWAGLNSSDGLATYGVYDWSGDNQQIMGWLSGDAML